MHIDEISKEGLADHELQCIIQHITIFWEGWRVNLDAFYPDVIDEFYNKIGEGATGVLYSGTLKDRENKMTNNNTAD